MDCSKPAGDEPDVTTRIDPHAASHRVDPEPIAALDTASALGLLGGNNTLYRDLLTIFCENEADTAARIRTAFLNADAALAHRLAHTLKSSAGSIGAIRLEKAALAVERAYRHGCRPGEDLIEELEAAHAKVMAGIDALTGNIGASHRSR